MPPRFSTELEVPVNIHREKDGSCRYDKTNLDLKFDKQGKVPSSCPHYILFRIKATGGCNHRFHQSMDEAFWVKEKDQTKPTKHDHLPYCRAIDIGSGGQTLLVQNDNPFKKDLEYALKLVSKDEPDIIIDPIMGNQNNGCDLDSLPFTLMPSRLALAPSTVVGGALLFGAALIGAALLHRERD